MSSYIKDELNCLELKTETDEDKYLVYKGLPDNRMIGQALKKKYNKKIKEAIKNLKSAELRDYLKDGYIMLGDIRLEKGWLKVEKSFKA